MPHRESAGLVMFRRCGDHGAQVEVLLGHPGGPFWQARHTGAWSIPKGGIHPGETLLETAIREFHEETSLKAAGPFLPLGSIVQRSGKIVHAWAFEGDCDTTTLSSVSTVTEWPPRSGRYIKIPELDRVSFFTLPDARTAINVAQAELLERLAQVLAAPVPPIAR